MLPPATFLINLDQDIHRLEKVDHELRKIGLPYERMKAVKGSDLDSSEWKAATSATCRAFCTPSMVGCFRSHFQCWKQVVVRGIPFALILEDDVTLEPDFLSQVSAAVSQKDTDWDVLLLGCFLCGNKAQQGSTNLLYKPKFFAGSHAYLVSANGAKKLVEKYPRATFHVDFVIWWDATIKVQALTKQVAHQRTLGGSGSYSSSGMIWPWFDWIKVDDGKVGLGFILGGNQLQILGVKISCGDILVICTVILLFVWRRWRRKNGV